MHRELPELKSLCQSLWKLVTTAATQQRYKLLGHFIYFQNTVGQIVLEGRENLRDLNSGLKQMDKFTLAATLPADKYSF